MNSSSTRRQGVSASLASKTSQCRPSVWGRRDGLQLQRPDQVGAEEVHGGRSLGGGHGGEIREEGMRQFNRWALRGRRVACRSRRMTPAPDIQFF